MWSSDGSCSEMSSRCAPVRTLAVLSWAVGPSLLSHGVGVGDCEKINLFQVRKGSWFSFFSPMVGSFVLLL